MNRFIIVFFVVIITSRFFSETLGVLPKAVDIIDLVVIPMLMLGAMGKPLRDVDRPLHKRISTLCSAFAVLGLVSAVINIERTNIGPTILYIFGFLEGPLMFIALNALIKDKRGFGEQMAKVINIIVLVQIAAVIFVNLPIFFLTGNPDRMSGTFGNNAYQFSAFLVLMGGYFLGRQTVNRKTIIYAIVVQIFILFTFVLLQYRSAVPAFFFAYLVALTLLYGKKIMRLGIMGFVFGVVGYAAFGYVQSLDFNLKYEDLITLAEDPSVLADYGKVRSYINTGQMYADHPHAIFFGIGPGTYISRANYTFTIEVASSLAKGKGVGLIVLDVFGHHNYYTDVQDEYIAPIMNMETLFGSIQVNNPNSSILATAAETGLPGLLLLTALYWTMIARGLKCFRYAKAKRDPVLMPLACALVTSSCYLCLISPLDNYMEISRVTLPVWLLFWTVNTLYRQRWQDEVLAKFVTTQEMPRQNEEPEPLPVGTGR